MTHRSTHALLAILLLTGAALPRAADASDQAQPTVAHHRHHAARHHHTSLAAGKNAAPAPVPTAAASTPASTPAPLPNESVSAPVPDKAPETSVQPSVFQLHYPPQGDGYVTGSSSQALDDRNAAKATGVQMTVPLPQ
jgi:hypothetical protein